MSENFFAFNIPHLSLSYHIIIFLNLFSNLCNSKGCINETSEFGAIAKVLVLQNKVPTSFKEDVIINKLPFLGNK